MYRPGVAGTQETVNEAVSTYLVGTNPGSPFASFCFLVSKQEQFAFQEAEINNLVELPN